jgi:putative Ca2+/H+ antiporter (TMEM165/GDT1 family)
VFGAAIANALPPYVVAGSVALLFAWFGVQSWLNASEVEDDSDIQEKSGHNVFFTTFLLITLAELGDKTQLAVVALSSTTLPLAVWLGATLALVSTSALGVWVGRTWLRKLPLTLLHRCSGSFFLLLASFAGYQAYASYTA